MHQVLLLETLVGICFCGVPIWQEAGMTICSRSITCPRHSYRERAMVQRKIPLELLLLQKATGLKQKLLSGLQRYIRLRDQPPTGIYPLLGTICDMNLEGVLLLGQIATNFQYDDPEVPMYLIAGHDDIVQDLDLRVEYEALLNIRPKIADPTSLKYVKAHAQELTRLVNCNHNDAINCAEPRSQPYDINDVLNVVSQEKNMF